MVVRFEDMLADGFKSHTNVLFSSSELAGREIGYQTSEAQQDIIPVKKLNGELERLSQVYRVICQENRRNKVSKRRLSSNRKWRKVNQLELEHHCYRYKVET